MKNPHAVALGKPGGESKSKAKAEAARKNGRKGGRPKNIMPQITEADACTFISFGTDVPLYRIEG